MRNLMYSTCPVVKTEILGLVDNVQAGNGHAFVPFEQKILWLRESECSLSLWHCGKALIERSTFHDYYGFLTSLGSAKEEAKTLMEHFQIRKASDLEIRIFANVTDIPVLEDLSRDSIEWNSNAKRRRYQSIDSSTRWFINDKELISKYEEGMKTLSKSDPENLDKSWKLYEKLAHLKIESKPVLKDLLAWSSSKGDIVNLAQLMSKA